MKNGILTIKGSVCGAGRLCAEAFYQGKKVGENTIFADNDGFVMQISLSEIHLWEAGAGRLYDLELTFNSDKVKSYFGMRSVRLCGKHFELNGKPVFQRTVLDLYRCNCRRQRH